MEIDLNNVRAVSKNIHFTEQSLQSISGKIEKIEKRLASIEKILTRIVATLNY